MKTFNVHKQLHDVFGETQTWVEVLSTIVFAIFGTWFIFTLADISPSNWRAGVAMLIIADILAGCIANFSRGTNNYYSAKPKYRWLFIAVHVHIMAVAWLLSADFIQASIVWGYTIASAVLVNCLNGNSKQLFVAANLLSYGVLLLVYLSMPVWLFLTSLFFMVKVIFSFSVEHYAKP